MSVGLYTHTTRATGTILTATIYNGDHVNHITNQNPLETGAYSDNVTQMQAATDPGQVGTESLAPHLGGELERLRFAIARLNGTSQWYSSRTNVQGANIASASTVNLDTAGGDYVHITGTTTITAITLSQGRQATVVFDGILTLTNGASLILPGGVSITTAVGDTAIVRGEAAGVVRVIEYTTPVVVSPIYNGLADGRLTLSTGVPVPTADVLAATSVFFTPFKGNRIATFNGTSWSISVFTEKTVAVPATTVTPFDVFIVDGTLALETVNWTSDTVRATALVLQDGILVKTGALTRRYLGTCRTTAVSGQCEDSSAKRYVWNYYNRMPRPLKSVDATAQWNYTTATFRQANGNAANQVEVVIGVSEDVVICNLTTQSSTSGGASLVNMVAGIGIDSSTANSAQINSGAGPTPSASLNNVQFANVAKYNGFPGIGKHDLRWLEWSTATGTTTWFGTGTTYQSGLTGEVRG